MPQTHFQLVALDIDGTVLDTKDRISESFKRAVARLASQGVRAVFCTGRRWRTALRAVEQIEHAHPIVVCSGGALIKEADSHNTLYADPFAPTSALRTAELFRRAGLVPILLLDRPVAGKELLISERQREQAQELPYVITHRDSIEYYPGDFPELSEPIFEVLTVDLVFRVRRGEQIVREAMAGQAIVMAMFQPRYGPDQIALEVHGPTATKWHALNWLLKLWQIRPENVVAIGDDVNDIPMLKGAGLSFAMGNAAPEVKAAARRVTSSIDEDGALEALCSVWPELKDD